MTIYKTWFIFLGMLYAALFIWGLSLPMRGSTVIPTLGLLVCVGGWFMADRYL